jgi:hypothetical protein
MDLAKLITLVRTHIWWYESNKSMSKAID